MPRRPGSSMKITIFGTGYVGLVTGACFADVGNDVIGVDVLPDRVARLNAGECPIYEPGLEPMLARNRKAGRISFAVAPVEPIEWADVLMIAVGTPPNEDGSSDLKYVLAVASTIGDHINEPKVIVTKSTVPVGTADKVRAAIEERLALRGLEIEFDVVSNPEFLKEGAAIEDFMRPDRIIVGADSHHAVEVMRELYAPFNRNHSRLMVMDVRSAEFTKYAANAMLATKISFMNELANVAERMGVDIEHVRIGIGSDPRIGYSFIYPGAGYGGSCFPKDVRALERSAAEAGYDAELLRAVESVNNAQKSRLFEKTAALLGDDLTGKKLALWGLAFKPNTDDMREAPSRAFMEAAWAAGATIHAHDPEAMDEARRHYPEQVASGHLVLCDTPDDAVDGADALVIATEWRIFRSPDFSDLKERMAAPVIIDGRNIYDPDRMRREGFAYYGIGLGDSVLLRERLNA
jgi:UDPglucose 6-dehydrogenase